MLQDLLLDNPRHGVCLPAPLTTTSRDQERASSLRPPLPEVGRAPGAEPLPHLRSLDTQRHLGRSIAW